MTTVRGERLMARAFPDNRSRSQFVLVFERASGLTAADRDILERVAARFTDEDHLGLPVIGVVTPKADIIGRRLLSADGKAGLVIVNLDREFMTFGNIEGLAHVEAMLDETREMANFPAGLEMGISGSAAIGGDMLAAVGDSIQNIELTTVVLVVAILLLVYRTAINDPTAGHDHDLGRHRHEPGGIADAGGHTGWLRVVSLQSL